MGAIRYIIKCELLVYKSDTRFIKMWRGGIRTDVPFPLKRSYLTEKCTVTEHGS